MKSVKSVDPQPGIRRQESVTSALDEAATLALESLRAQPARSALAIIGVVIGIVTVVLVASTLVGLRNSVALLFRELGTENLFAYHLAGEPYPGAHRGRCAAAADEGRVRAGARAAGSLHS